jgi:hypothetical protein
MNIPAPAFDAPADQPSSGALRRTRLAGPRAACLAVLEALAAQAGLAE